ncbi:MAG: dihydropyrimidine dehydrogenase, partial [candidate division Zixibacteria bacterium]|nr:dihydropyrimidine dehydrogenase [candidate division Zixibacteria bacterium]
SVTLIKAEPGEVDSSGRRIPVDIKGSEFEIEVDSVIIAIGQSPTFSGSDIVNTDQKGLIVTNPDNMATSSPGIFAGGDAVNGGTTVVQAVADGRKAAEAIGKMFAVL